MMKQTALRRVRISTNGVTQHASFVFPFFDRHLDVRFLLLITDEGHFVFPDKLNLETQSDLLHSGILLEERPRRVY